MTPSRPTSPPSIQTVRIGWGHHLEPGDEVCVGELASMLAGEPFSDHPAAALTRPARGSTPVPLDTITPEEALHV